MADDVVVIAEPRSTRGSGPAGRSRRAGRLPAVVYGLGTEATAVSVPVHELSLILAKGANTVITLRLDGDDQLTLVRQVQRHPVRGDLVQTSDAVAELGEARFVERKVDAVVHPVARQDQVGLQSAQDTPQPLMDVGTRKGPAGMPDLRQPRGRLARQPQIEDLGSVIGLYRPESRLEELHPFAPVGDAVAKHHDAGGRADHAGGLGRQGLAPRRHEADLAQVHDRTADLLDRPDRQRVAARGERDTAQVTDDEVLEMPRLLDDEREQAGRLVGGIANRWANRHLHAAATLPLPASLQNGDRIPSRLLQIDRPEDAVLGIRPIADRILVWLRFIAKQPPFATSLTGRQPEAAVGLVVGGRRIDRR